MKTQTKFRSAFLTAVPKKMGSVLWLTIFFLPFCETFSQNPNTWISKANFPVARNTGVGFSIGTKGYVGTGAFDSTGGHCKDFWEWDQASDAWTQKANFGGGARFAAVGFSIGAKGYIGIGQDNVSVKKDLWEYDPGTNNWTQKANFSGPALQYAVGFSIGTKGYIGIGSGYKDFWEWDQVTDTWAKKANFGGLERFAAVGFSIGTKGYIGTGRDASGFTQTFWEWDQATNGWTQKANFGGVGRFHAVGFSIGIKGYIGTGWDGSNTVNSTYKDFWEWDQTTNKWTQKADVGGAPRNAAMGFSIGNKGYICGGWQELGTSKPSHDDFWEYTPDTTTGCVAYAVISSDPSGTVCVGAQVFVSASGGTSYSWNTGATTANIVVNPGVTTTYSLTVTDANGCTGTATLTVPVDPNCTATGISQFNDASHQITIWPNPSHGDVGLRISDSGFKNAELRIYDMFGEMVFKSLILNPESSIHLDLPGGIYYLRVKTDPSSGSGGAAIQKLIINK